MRRIVAFVGLLFLAFVLIFGSSNEGMRLLSQRRYMRQDGWGADKFTFGDLYGLTYIKPFKMPRDTSFVSLPVLETDSIKYKMHILGDSYLYSFFSMDPRYFEKTGAVQFVRWSTPKAIPYQLATDKKNILLIECVERNFRQLMQVQEIRNRIEAQPTAKAVIQSSRFAFLSQINARVKETLYHPTLENNLEFLLFNLGIWAPFKELKSALNFYVIGRLDNDVRVSKNWKQLYLTQTVDPEKVGSSFYPTSDEEVAAYVAQLTEVEAYFKAKGFDHVIFSIIPNPVGVLNTENKPTNQIISRMATHPAWKGILVDPTLRLQKNAKDNFFPSDSHWNQRGAAIWLGQLNETLRTL
jgi:hypothetical protein